MKDLIIPIVFPDYRITVTTPATDVDLLPWVNFDNFSIPSTKQKLSNLGHAGVMLANGKTGQTKYYEYGRYDAPENKGIVRRVPIPNASAGREGINLDSLQAPLHRISQVAGQGGRIQAVVIDAIDIYFRVNEMTQQRKQQNSNPNRLPYDLTTNSCIHFVKWVVESAGKSTPWMADPRPNSYIGEFRDDYRDLDYNPATRKVVLEAA